MNKKKSKLFLKFKDSEIADKAFMMIEGGAKTATTDCTNGGKDCTDPQTAINSDNVVTSVEYDGNCYELSSTESVSRQVSSIESFSLRY